MRIAATVALLVSAGASVQAAPRTYVVDASASQVRIDVGRAGLFSFAGHEHVVDAPRMAGSVTVDEADPSASAVELTFEAGALTVRPEKEPEGDAPKVEEAMRGPKLLDVARFPTITFRSREVAARPSGPGRWALQVAGDMTIHGVTRALTLSMEAERAGGLLTTTGRTTLRHDWFGLKPISVAGVVKVKNEIGVTWTIVSRAAE